VRTLILASLAAVQAFGGTLGIADESADLPELRALYEADQAARLEENVRKGIVPTLQEERDRRFAVFQIIANGKLKMANDHFRAGLILHHTSGLTYDDGHTESLGTESSVLAFFLFKRAYELGYESGQDFMAKAYNYYLNACDQDSEKFGYRFEEGEPVWRPTASGAEIDALKCGFDPRPYFTSSDRQTESTE
jgi:hypothetical protein